jgi:hypothetical protein
MNHELDDGFGWFGLVWHKSGAIRIAPVRKVYHSRRLRGVDRRLVGRLHDVQTVGIEKEGVISVPLVEPRNQLVIFRNGLAIVLGQSLLDLFRRQFHRTLLIRPVVDPSIFDRFSIPGWIGFRSLDGMRTQVRAVARRRQA